MMTLLQSQLPKPGSKVAILMNPCLELVPVIIGILKLGASYIPINTDWSNEDVISVLEATHPDVFLCENTSRFSGISIKTEILDVHTFLVTAAEYFVTHKPTSADHCPATSAAVIFCEKETDGTFRTIPISHQLIFNRIFAHWEKLPFGNTEIVIMKSSIASTDSLVELFGALLAGKCILLLPQEVCSNLEMFFGILETNTVRRFSSDSSNLIKMCSFLKTHNRHFYGSLKLVMVTGAGDLSPELAEQFFEYFPRCKLGHAYSVPELAGDVAWCIFDDKADLQQYILDEIVPCGVPIHPFDLVIVSENMKALPDGIAGELYIDTYPVLDRTANTSGKNSHLLKTGVTAFICPKKEFLYVMPAQREVTDFPERRDEKIILPEEETLERISPQNTEPVAQVYEAVDMTPEAEIEVVNFLTAGIDSSDLDDIAQENLKVYVKTLLDGMKPPYLTFALNDESGIPCAVNMSYDPFAIQDDLRKLLFRVDDPQHTVMNLFTDSFIRTLPQILG